MKLRAKYVTEFTIKKGRIVGSRVLGGEFASEEQQKAIDAIKPMLRAFVKSRLHNLNEDATWTRVHVSFVETNHGLELSFKA